MATPRGEAALNETTQPGMILGSPGYMAPEQAEGKDADWRSDLFSLGVILLEMATGRRPFQGASSAAVLSSLLRDTPPLVTETRPELPAELARVVRRCLHKDPSKRLQSALDLRNELDELRTAASPAVGTSVAETPGNEPRATEPSSDTAILAGLLRRRSRSLVAGVTALALVAAVAVFAARRWGAGAVAGGPIDSVAVLPFVNASGSPDADYLSAGVTETLTNSLARSGRCEWSRARWPRSTAIARRMSVMPPRI